MIIPNKTNPLTYLKYFDENIITPTIFINPAAFFFTNTAELIKYLPFSIRIYGKTGGNGIASNPSAEEYWNTEGAGQAFDVIVNLKNNKDLSFFETNNQQLSKLISYYDRILCYRNV